MKIQFLEKSLAQGVEVLTGKANCNWGKVDKCVELETSQTNQKRIVGPGSKFKEWAWFQGPGGAIGALQLGFS